MRCSHSPCQGVKLVHEASLAFCCTMGIQLDGADVANTAFQKSWIDQDLALTLLVRGTRASSCTRASGMHPVSLMHSPQSLYQHLMG